MTGYASPRRPTSAAVILMLGFVGCRPTATDDTVRTRLGSFDAAVAAPDAATGAAATPAASDAIAATASDATTTAVTASAVVVPRTASSPGPVKFVGTITDYNTSCAADHTCAIRVNDVWIAQPGGYGVAPRPGGKFIGIHLGGGTIDPRTYLGRRAEVFAQRTPVGVSPLWNDRAMTLEGDPRYYVRLLDEPGK